MGICFDKEIDIYTLVRKTLINSSQLKSKPLTTRSENILINLGYIVKKNVNSKFSRKNSI